MIRAFEVADLFAGAGGCTTGCLQAADTRGLAVRVTAVNHWPTAVETHTRNHPEARHFCASIETLDPRVAIPSGKLDLLIAAPECVFFSSARGGKPIDDQRRSSAWHILRWLELLRVDEVLIENVPEMRAWAPLGANGKPLKSKKGHVFEAFVQAIRALNYRVEWKVLNAADFGAATTRRRLFIRATRGTKAIAWPAVTHSKTGTATLFGGVKKWRAAREIIDWSLPSQSIFTRKRPLQPATLRRIFEGLRRFGGQELEPFLVLLRNNATGQTVDEPISTMTAGGGHHGLVEPVIVKLTHGDRKRERSVDEPLPTITTANRGELGIAEPFIVEAAHGDRVNGGPRVRSVDEPLATQPATNRFALAEPFLVPFYTEREEEQHARVRSLGNPLHTVTATGSGNVGLVEPFILGQQSGGNARLVSEPIPTVAADGALAVVEPFVLPVGGRQVGRLDSIEDPIRTVTSAAGHTFGLVEPFIFANRNNNIAKTIDEPVPSLCTADHIGVVEPLITKYNGTAKSAKPVSDPLETVTSKDRFGLVQPVINGYTLDIRFRMLQPHELSAAMSFPKSYVFTGNKGDQIRQIGNAVDCSMARALCGAILDARRAPAKKDAEAVA